MFCCVNEQFCESYIERANSSMIRSMSSDGLHVRSFSVRCFYSLFFQWWCAQYNNLALKLLEMFRILASSSRRYQLRQIICNMSTFVPVRVLSSFDPRSFIETVTRRVMQQKSWTTSKKFQQRHKNRCLEASFCMRR